MDVRLRKIRSLGPVFALAAVCVVDALLLIRLRQQWTAWQLRQQWLVSREAAVSGPISLVSYTPTGAQLLESMPRNTRLLVLFVLRAGHEPTDGRTWNEALAHVKAPGLIVVGYCEQRGCAGTLTEPIRFQLADEASLDLAKALAYHAARGECLLVDPRHRTRSSLAVADSAQLGAALEQRLRDQL